MDQPWTVLDRQMLSRRPWCVVLGGNETDGQVEDNSAELKNMSAVAERGESGGDRVARMRGLRR